MAREYQNQRNNSKGGNTNFSPSRNANNGCKSGTNKKGNPWIAGWNKSKDRGFVKATVNIYSGSHIVTSGTGKQHQVMMAEIQYVDSGMVDHYPVTYCITTGKCLLEKHGWLLNTKTGTMTRFSGKK